MSLVVFKANSMQHSWPTANPAFLMDQTKSISAVNLYGAPFAAADWRMEEFQPELLS